MKEKRENREKEREEEAQREERVLRLVSVSLTQQRNLNREDAPVRLSYRKVWEAFSW